MHLVTFYIDGAEGARRTYILAGTATDALLLVHDGNHGHQAPVNPLVVGIEPLPAVLMILTAGRHQLDGLDGAVTGTVAAGLSVLGGNAV